jgi:hypothetical protein
MQSLLPRSERCYLIAHKPSFQSSQRLLTVFVTLSHQRGKAHGCVDSRYLQMAPTHPITAHATQPVSTAARWQLGGRNGPVSA